MSMTTRVVFCGCRPSRISRTTSSVNFSVASCSARGRPRALEVEEDAARVLEPLGAEGRPRRRARCVTRMPSGSGGALDVADQHRPPPLAFRLRLGGCRSSAVLRPARPPARRRCGRSPRRGRSIGRRRQRRRRPHAGMRLCRSASLDLRGQTSSTGTDPCSTAEKPRGRLLVGRPGRSARTRAARGWPPARARCRCSRSSGNRRTTASYAPTAFRSCASVGGGSATVSSRSRAMRALVQRRAAAGRRAASGTADASADVDEQHRTKPEMSLAYRSCASTSSK